MIKSIINERLKNYSINTLEEKEDALKEILQEIILYGLANAEFFKHAVFHGGTSLRILYNLPRFSEGLDFMLKKPNKHFVWKTYMDVIITTCKEFGIIPDVIDKSQADKTVQKMFQKNNSIGKILDLTFKHYANKKLTIKLEIDTNPPVGLDMETKFLDFPLDFSIITQDLSSNFAGKIHALLCRTYTKGRDWYDFSWYFSRKVTPNLKLLRNALRQQGPWQGQKISVSLKWLHDNLIKRIQEIQWNYTINDVAPFLRSLEKQSLNVWGVDFFTDKINKLNILMQDTK